MSTTRAGGFYAYNDGSGTQLPDPKAPFMVVSGGACASKSALRTTGMGFTVWGAGVGTDLANMAGTKMTYNASAYTGIRFMAKAGSAVAVRFKVQDKDTAPEGGVCMKDKCNDDFGKDLMLSTDWKVYTVKFSEMTQQGWGQMFPSVLKDKLYGLQFQFAMGVAFDLWVDNIALVK
jgi:hypothetical protein